MQRNIKTTLSTVFSSVVLTAAMLSITTTITLGWTGPSASPPNGNVPAPINVGAADQIKEGALGLGGLAVFGNAYIANRLGVGTTNPTAALDIETTTGVDETGMVLRTISAADRSPWSIVLENTQQDSFYWGIMHDYGGGFRIARSGDSVYGTPPFYIAKDGQIGLGGYPNSYRLSIAGTGQNAIYFKNVAYTPSRPSGGALLYADVGEIRALDANGNITVLSPHRFDLIPGGASEPMAWSFYSERETEDGKYRINVDMAQVVRLVEQLTGEQLVYIERNGVEVSSRKNEGTTKKLESRVAELELLLKQQQHTIERLQSELR